MSSRRKYDFCQINQQTCVIPIFLGIWKSSPFNASPLLLTPPCRPLTPRDPLLADLCCLLMIPRRLLTLLYCPLMPTRDLLTQPVPL